MKLFQMIGKPQNTASGIIPFLLPIQNTASGLDKHFGKSEHF
jgi:hypothetical protein